MAPLSFSSIIYLFIYLFIFLPLLCINLFCYSKAVSNFFFFAQSISI
ncbi:MAG: hypothetical protein N7Q72_02450 [Spiroplasma sp. Tabriz.8]|nr:hypothetical protein [Spiroplasma sp. Tabriz.8]